MYEDKAKKIERQLLKGLNEEPSWAAKHPGWMTAITVGIFAAFVAAVVRGCH